VARIDRERGEGRLGVMITVVVLGVAGFAAIQYVPVKIAAYEFHDTIRQEARYAATRDTTEVVTQRILEKAAVLEIPLVAKNVRVQKTRSEVMIDVSYVQPIDFKVATYDYRFHARERAPLF
jgi:hypothetical protein